ncbi:MAG: GNAT family N-acetyltransferase, partial [Bacillota bacterium]|nr:GNAT family N-acetyltransferase [Bacillota bacterium]
MLKFEKADSKDAEALTKVQIRAFSNDVKICGGGPPGYDSVDKQISLMKNQIYYKILDFGKIIGGFIVKSEGKGQYELYRLFIDPDYQGKGIGSRTLMYIEKELIDAVKIVLETPSFNIKNHAFY